MALFQRSVLNKYLKQQDDAAIRAAYARFRQHFHTPEIQANIRNSKEEQYQEGFLRDLFVDILSYTLNPQPGFQLTTEFKNEKGSKKADGAILAQGKALAVIELKGTDTTDLASINAQAFHYKANHTDCVYVITSNFERLRFYIDNAVEHLEFDLFTLCEEQFRLLWLCLQRDNLLSGLPKRVKAESVQEEEQVTKRLYKDYSAFKNALWKDLCNNHPDQDKLLLYKLSQKLLDRFLFMLFAEDKLLIEPNTVKGVIDTWQRHKDEDAYEPLYNRFKKYFGYLDAGKRPPGPTVFGYNGGLFRTDELIDSLVISDTVLHDHLPVLAKYYFESEVDVNILGHIFEHSLNEIEAITAQIEGRALDTKKTKRKKDGVFYTPKYITKYIVENTVGRLCAEKKDELALIDEDYARGRKGRQKKTIEGLLSKLVVYRDWLLSLTICDPACGSGAFLNQALDFLIAEHAYVNELESKVRGESIVFKDIGDHILERNIYGVDINEESVEIARLSLWLRTATKGRKLNDLSGNIKCGNSLIDDPAVAGAKAFDWQKEFPAVFAKDGFDVVIGNPPYGAHLTESDVAYFRENYSTVIGHSEAYYLFCERGLRSLVSKGGMLGYIIPNAWLSNKYAMGVRELFIRKTQIDRLINLNRQLIFDEAGVETSIIVCMNETPTNHVALVGQDVDHLYEYKQTDWERNANLMLSFAPDTAIDGIVRKMNASAKRLADVLDVSNGFKPYQAGYGLNLLGVPLTEDDVANKIYHSKIPTDGFKPEIKGKGVHRYSMVWEESYVRWGKWLMSPKGQHYFEQPKILIRQIISDYFFAVLDESKMYADQSLYVVTTYDGGKKDDLYFYLGLLNSKLYGFYFRKFYSEEDDLFPKIKAAELKNLPVPDATTGIANEVTALAKQLSIELPKLIRLKTDFTQLLKAKYTLPTLSRALENWPSLEFKGFLAELKKAKVSLSLAEEAEWLPYFTEQKAKAQALQAQIQKTDTEIDALVYKLYGLTEEEVKVVESTES